MSNEAINQIRQLLCQPDTPTLRKQVYALCTKPWMLDMAENSIPGLGAWWERQHEIAKALELHKHRNDEGADYSECRFSMKDLAGADLSSAHLFRADFRGANLSSAHLSEATLRLADLRGADLSEATLSDADLRRADLRGADLEDADLSRAMLSGARYNEHTRFPEGFNPRAQGMTEVG